uniref:Uncharacterized protein n=1 Tax=Ciona savignyi TaxID=51511 RepID=H2Z8J4_CIOSA
NPSTNPPTQFSTTKPTTQNPDTLPSNSHPRNISLEPRCTDSNNCC